VREVFPELGNSDLSFFMLSSKALWETGRVRIYSDESLSPLSRGHPTFFVHDEDTSPTSSPGHGRLAAASPAPSTLSGSSGSRSRQHQNVMRQRVLQRDGNRCVVCGCDNVAYLECAHIVDDAVNKRKDLDAILEAAGLKSTFDVINGLTNRGDEAIKEHEAILQALISGDVSAAIFSMRKHIESGWDRLKEALKEAKTNQ
jgi:hypothetical protein